MSLTRADRSLLGEWWLSIDRPLLAALLVLIGFGFILSLAASPAIALRKGFDAFHFVERHMIYVALGLITIVCVSFFSPLGMRRFSLLLLIGSFALMLTAILAGPKINGAHRWVEFAGQRLQPSELFKPAFVVMIAWLFAAGAHIDRSSSGAYMAHERARIGIAVVIAGLGVALLLAQPDFGQAMLISMVFGGLFVVSGLKLRWVMLLGVIGAAVAATAYARLDHVRSRIDLFLNPSSGDTYQQDRAMRSFLEGGWLGKGPGEGTIKTSLPDAHTDFIFAVIAEEYGVLACIVLLGLFVFIAARAFLRLRRAESPFARNAIAGLVILISLQALINMGVNTAILPAKGMTLPFISYGGSSMLGMAIAAGMLLGLTRRGLGVPQARARGARVSEGKFVSAELSVEGYDR